MVDLKTLTTISKVDTYGPDAIAYDSNRGEVYVFNHKGNSATVIDSKEAKVVATIPLEGSPEFGVADWRLAGFIVTSKIRMKSR